MNISCVGHKETSDRPSFMRRKIAFWSLRRARPPGEYSPQQTSGAGARETASAHWTEQPTIPHFHRRAGRKSPQLPGTDSWGPRLRAGLKSQQSRCSPRFSGSLAEGKVLLCQAPSQDLLGHTPWPSMPLRLCLSLLPPFSPFIPSLCFPKTFHQRSRKFC